MLFLGRHVGYPVALEGALKLKELAYMHAEGFAAGELKHGPIALIEEGLPVIVVMPSPKNAATLHAKLLSNIREIQARGAVTIVIAEEGDDTVRPYADHIFEIPAVSTLFQPLLSTVPLQVFAARWPGLAATTSTSRATWPSPSRSSDGRAPADRETGRRLDRRRLVGASLGVPMYTSAAVAPR